MSEILTIPDYQSIMLPLLKLSSDGQEHSSRQRVEKLADAFGLTKEEKETIYPTKKVSIFYDRVHWALSYLKNARLIEGTKRGFYKITKRGVDVLKLNPQVIDVKYLKQFPEFNDFLTRSNKDKETESISDKEHPEDITNKTPEEVMEDGYQLIRENLVREILENVKKSNPNFFERFVVQLLVAMGYGGTIKEAGRAIGKTGDEGIDGIIKEDILGLDIIYIQAKKWDGTVGRPEIQKFVGALQGQRAKRGIFITTGNFSDVAKEYVSNIDSKIVLVDGNQLGEYLIDYSIGVTTEKIYQIKKVNLDYFSEEIL